MCMYMGGRVTGLESDDELEEEEVMYGAESYEAYNECCHGNR